MAKLGEGDTAKLGEGDMTKRREGDRKRFAPVILGRSGI
jgi:hypothetical protein